MRIPKASRLALRAIIAFLLAGIPLIALSANAATATDLTPCCAPDTNVGFWLLGTDGGVFSFGTARFYGSTGNMHLNAPAVSMTPTNSSNGYRIVASDGGVFSFGDAQFFGSMGGQHLNALMIGIASDSSGNGYWTAAADGGVFSFGGAQFYGSMGGTHLNAPIVDFKTTPTGHGYWLLASDGGVFAFGDAAFYGSGLNSSFYPPPVVGMAPIPDGHGYFLLRQGGHVDAMNLAWWGDDTSISPSPRVGIAASSGFGYWIAHSDGTVYNFSAAPNLGSLSGQHLNAPIRAIVRS